MFYFYSLGRTYTASMERCVPRGVRCEQCCGEYVYFLERVGVGHGFSFLDTDDTGAQKRAKANAHKELIRALNQDCEPIPCPDCGHIQKTMIPRAKQLRNGWMWRPTAYLFLMAIICSVPALFATGHSREHGHPAAVVIAILGWAGVGVGLVGALVVPIYWYLANRRFDPNAEDAEARKERGRVMAIYRTEFEQQHPGQDTLPEFWPGGKPPEIVRLDEPEWLTPEITDNRSP